MDALQKYEFTEASFKVHWEQVLFVYQDGDDEIKSILENQYGKNYLDLLIKANSERNIWSKK